ncbi:hypothetical protein [Flaviflagellibacter deserti]|jgi:hypothetical protein|uniref:Uncharacterized protein n=1 Tax=Flaviflagellibacter deserti TaxID=2267266 RepID=A0ABV9Z421_9HYPH
MGAFQVNAKGYYLYTPSWQRDPGATMRAANRATYDNMVANQSTAANNLIGGSLDSTAGMVQLTMQIANERVQTQLQERYSSALSGLDTLA